jgi:hypothetical protein
MAFARTGQKTSLTTVPLLLNSCIFCGSCVSSYRLSRIQIHCLATAAYFISVISDFKIHIAIQCNNYNANKAYNIPLCKCQW